MKTSTKTILSLGYWFSALSLGLLTHPYATLRKMIRDRVLRPLVFLPLVASLVMWAATMILVRLGGLILLVLGISFPVGVSVGLGFLFWWVAWFMVLWQVVLGYLFVRFWVVLR